MGNACVHERLGSASELVVGQGAVPCPLATWNSAWQAGANEDESYDESLRNQELLKASMEGHSVDVLRQLEAGACKETRRPFRIVFNGIDPDMQHKDNEGLTPLMHAALGGHVHTVKALLDAGAHVNAEDEDRLRPLHFAAKAGNDVIFTMLLEARADPCSPDSEGLTPIDHWAAEVLFQGESVSALQDGDRLALTQEDAVKEREEPPIVDLAPGAGSFHSSSDAEETHRHALRCAWACHPGRPPVRFPEQNPKRSPELALPMLLGSMSVPCYLPAKE